MVRPACSDARFSRSGSKRFALDELHHERRVPTELLEAVDLRDVWMIQRRQDLRFPSETGQTVGVGRERVRKDLQRDVAIERRVARAVDLAHAAHAEQFGDLVRTQESARCESQLGVRII